MAKKATVSKSPGLPPGTYTKDTLPPAGPEVQAILDRVYARGEELRRARKNLDVTSRKPNKGEGQ